MDKNIQNNENTKKTTKPYLHPGPSKPFGYVIGNLDPSFRETLGLPEECASVGIVTSKDKSADILFGADEAVK